MSNRLYIFILLFSFIRDHGRRLNVK